MQGCREVLPVCRTAGDKGQLRGGEGQPVQGRGASLPVVTTKGGCRINDLRSLGRRLFLKEITFFFRSFAI